LEPSNYAKAKYISIKIKTRYKKLDYGQLSIPKRNQDLECVKTVEVCLSNR